MKKTLLTLLLILNVLTVCYAQNKKQEYSKFIKTGWSYWINSEREKPASNMVFSSLWLNS